MKIPSLSIKKTTIELSQQQIKLAAKLAASYLVRHNLQSGRFVYRTYLDPDFDPKPRYNWLRHAGAIYALADYHQHFPNKALHQVIKKSTMFLSKVVVPLRKAESWGVISDPKMTYSKSPRSVAKLGGTGLGLVALCHAKNLEVCPIPTKVLHEMGAFLQFMQKEDGRFVSRFDVAKGVQDDSWRSLYYPGEACLGLVQLWSIDRQVKWLKSAIKCLLFLARERSRNPDKVPVDHWALIASAYLIPAAKRSRLTFDKDQILQHMHQVVSQIIKEAPPAAHSSPSTALSQDQRSVSTATRLEALIASYPFLSGDIRQKAYHLILTGLGFLLLHQVSVGDLAGGIPLGGDVSSSAREEIRIDYVQHALSAFLGFLLLKK